MTTIKRGSTMFDTTINHPTTGDQTKGTQTMTMRRQRRRGVYAAVMLAIAVLVAVGAVGTAMEQVQAGGCNACSSGCHMELSPVDPKPNNDNCEVQRNGKGPRFDLTKIMPLWHGKSLPNCVMEMLCDHGGEPGKLHRSGQKMLYMDQI